MMKVTQLVYEKVPSPEEGKGDLTLKTEHEFHIEGWRVFIISHTQYGTFIAHQFNSAGAPIGEFVKESIEEVIKLREECIHGQ